MTSNRVRRWGWATFGATVVVALIGAWVAMGSSSGDSVRAPGDPTAKSYSEGDFIGPLEAVAVETPVEDGTAIVVVDDYGNETPAVVRDGGVWATGTTVPTTAAGAEALGVIWTGDAD